MENRESAADPQPSVTVIMPILNEERHLRAAVDMILRQDYAGALDVVLALGPSTDRTDQVAAELVAAHPQVRVVRNPSGRTPDALNTAISASQGEVVVRVDGHAEIPGDYVRVAVEELTAVGADNVGGVMDAQGITPFQRAVACAMRSPIGVGNSRFHIGGDAGESDTVYLGVFRRSALARVGGYDPHFACAQDWELNHRIRESGGRVWFTPRLRVTYRPRGDALSLGKQYFYYGRWRRVVARYHEGTINLRYLAPPAMVLGVTAATVAAPVWPIAMSVPAAYGVGVVVGGLAMSRAESIGVRLRAPLALAVMRWAWGIGFLTSPRSIGR